MRWLIENPDEMAHSGPRGDGSNEPSHLDLHYLPRLFFRSVVLKELNKLLHAPSINAYRIKMKKKEFSFIDIVQLINKNIR